MVDENEVESHGNADCIAGSPADSHLPSIYVGAGQSVSGVLEGEPPASSHVGLCPSDPHQVAPLLKHPPPRASPFTNSCMTTTEEGNVSVAT
jgi:hypothetical protein